MPLFLGAFFPQNSPLKLSDLHIELIVTGLIKRERWYKWTFKLAGENAGVITWRWRTHSSPSAMTKPLPNMGSLSCLNTRGFPQLLPITPEAISFKKSGSAMYKNGSVPNQYMNTFPTRHQMYTYYHSCYIYTYLYTCLNRSSLNSLHKVDTHGNKCENCIR